MKILILSPLALEYKAVQIHLEYKERGSFDGMAYETGSFLGRHHKYEVIICQTGPKNKAMALTTERLIQHFKPSLVFLLGVAGGVKDVDLLDVLMGTKTYDYEAGKITSDGFVSRPETLYFSPDLVSLAQTIAQDDQWKASDVYFGPIAAGEKVIASVHSGLYKRIKTFFNDTLAVDMEAYGFAETLQHYPLIKFAVIRGISDLLENKSNSDTEGSQSKAAAHAAAFLFELLFQLNYRQLKLPVMELKQLAGEIFEQLFSEIEGKERQAAVFSDKSNLNKLKKKISKLIPDSFQELVDDPTDTDLQGAFKVALRKLMAENKKLQNQLFSLLKKKNKASDKGKTVVKKKNVISGSKITVENGDFHQGDKTSFKFW